MSRFLLYCDEDSHSVGLAAALRAAGLDVLRSSDAGMNGSPDSQQLAFAFRERRVLYTSNAGDFADLHRAALSRGDAHAGVLIWPRKRRYDIGEQARRILWVWDSVTAEEFVNRSEFLGNWNEDRQ